MTRYILSRLKNTYIVCNRMTQLRNHNKNIMFYHVITSLFEKEIIFHIYIISLKRRFIQPIKNVLGFFKHVEYKLV